MTIYLVRHGESEGNLAKTHQNDLTPLSVEGLLQATKVANRFTHTPIDLIISSTAQRARQTAGKIQKKLGCPIEFDEKLKEQKGPTEVAGRSWEEPDVKVIWEKIGKNHHNPYYHYSDEENNTDFIHRVSEAVITVSKRDADSILVVTHGYLIRAVLGLVTMGPEFTSRQYQYMKKAVFTKNTGVTICEFTTAGGWKLLTYNDHAHLLE